MVSFENCIDIKIKSFLKR